MQCEPPASPTLERFSIVIMSIAGVGVETACRSPGSESILGWSVFVGLVFGVFFAHAWLRRLSLTTSPPALAAPVLVGLFFIPILLASVTPFGERPPWELQLLAGFRNVGLGLAALSAWPVCLRLTGLVSLFLVLFACCLTEDRAMPWVLVAYAGAASFWLTLLYWHQLCLTNRSVGVPAMNVFLMLLIVGVVAAGTAMGPRKLGSALFELVASSGGTSQFDPQSRGGIGDGDEEVAGMNAQTVGMVETDQFLESEGSTLYDVASDMFGKPHKPKHQPRMIPLSTMSARELPQRPKEMQGPSREFSTVRHTPPVPKNLHDVRSRALMWVKGRTPVHFRMKAYDHFDGYLLHEMEPEESRWAVHPVPERGRQWFSVAGPKVPYMEPEPIQHTVQIVRLNEGRLPTPAHWSEFRLGLVDQVDFFTIPHEGVLAHRKDVRGIPFLVRSRLFQPKHLTESLWPTVDQRAMRETTNDVLSDRLQTLAADWTRDVSKGWGEVEAIASRLQVEYTLDRNAVPPIDCLNSAEHFLFESKRGPEYLFATSAALMLRTLGYPTRVAGGFYARPERRDALTGLTAVLPEDLHYWTEVRLAPGEWVIVEPSPGYQVLRADPSLLDRLHASVEWLRSVAWNQRWLLASLTLAAVLVYLMRVRILDQVHTLGWYLARPSDARPLLISTWRLIETRARRAGLSRPVGNSARRWTEERFPNDAESIHWLASQFSWAGYAPADAPPPEPSQQIGQKCRQVLREWTFQRFHSLAKKGTH